MTIAKALKYGTDKIGHGHYHRDHRAKRSKKPRPKPVSHKREKYLREIGKMV